MVTPYVPAAAFPPNRLVYLASMPETVMVARTGFRFWSATVIINEPITPEGSPSGGLEGFVVLFPGAETGFVAVLAGLTVGLVGDGRDVVPLLPEFAGVVSSLDNGLSAGLGCVPEGRGGLGRRPARARRGPRSAGP